MKKLGFIVMRNHRPAGTSLVPRLRSCSTRFKASLKAGDSLGMEETSEEALTVMVSLFDLLRGEQDARRLSPTVMAQATGHIATNLTSAERSTMIRRARLDQGYLTAYNNFVAPDGNITAGTDSEGVTLWVDSYCQAHPLDGLADAAAALVAELRARKR
jgi:hypothetical protein